MKEGRPRRPWERTDPAEREYFDLLGDGLVVQLLARPQGISPGGGWSPPVGGAWLHLGADGAIEAFTGKVEVGQGTRTALSLAVAEELKIPLDRVVLHMGDTDLCPWDMGTFGSRSMPDALPPLRAVAAGARQTLVDLAAARRGVDRKSLEAGDGEVRTRGETTGITYAELVRGLRQVVTVGLDTPVISASSWVQAGHPTVDPRDEDVVTGRRIYTSDLHRPGMLYGALLFPPSYGARLLSADTTEVGRREGITVVRDGDFLGVVARNPREAHRAVAQIRAEWKAVPQPSEAEIEGYLRSHPSQGEGWDLEKRTVGDAEGNLRKSPIRVEETYRTAYLAHTPLETRAAVAEWEGERLSVWVGTQTPFRARKYVAEGLKIPEEDVRVRVPATGGGFGGKHGGDVALAAARLAKAVGKPVQLTFHREEEFRHGYFRPMAIIDVRAGADREGHLVAWTFHNVNAGAAALLPPYRIPHQMVDNELSDSPLPQGPYRSLAAVANNFARESVVDELAALSGRDPLSFREQNLGDDRLLDVLHLAVEKSGWKDWVPAKGRGHGLAIGHEKQGRLATVAEVTVDARRKVRVDRLVSVFEAGAVVHPENLRSQVEGAAVMALGGALFEAIHFDGGMILNPRLSEYRVPRFSDLPRIEAHLLDRKDLPPAGGGETPLIAVAPAIGNALFDATGVRLRSLPLVPEGTVPRPGGRRSAKRHP